jgi:hypothetical protein
MDDPTHPLSTLTDALEFLRQASAPPRLLRHAELVAELANELATELVSLGVSLNRGEIMLGAALHDAGKIVCPDELTKSGHRHEVAGEQFLLDRGVPARVARFARTHGLKPAELTSIEDMVVALADKLWRGARNADLESALIDAVATQLATNRWDLFTRLDDCFERISADGHARLARQRDA